MVAPYSFDEFFASNREESVSPFLTQGSRRWARHLQLRSSLAAGSLLAVAFACSFASPPLGQLLVALVYLLVGTPALIHTLHDLSRADINIDVLMTLAAFLSVVIGSEFEGALLLVLFELSASMELFVTQKTRSSVMNLRKLHPPSASVIGPDGHLTETFIREVAVEALIFVKAGEVVPLDGVVVDGRSYVNLVHLTGETAPLPKGVGDEVPAGGVTLEGSLTLRVLRNNRDSTLNRIIQMITHAQETKPRTEQLFERFSRAYATTIIALAASFALVLPYLLKIPYLGPEGGIYRALAFLIAASPCALIFAVPTAYLSALTACARKGILLKGGIMFDALNQCRTIALDKTGTLTTGKLAYLGQQQLYGPPLDPSRALSLIASLEKHAVHPMAQAVVDVCQHHKLPLLPVEQMHLTPGLGIEGIVDGMSLAVGHRNLIQAKVGSSFNVPEVTAVSTFFWIQGSVGILEFQDALREGAEGAIAQLKEQQLKTVMLTGDHAVNAHRVGKALKIDEVYPDLRPEDKLEKIGSLSREAGLIMVGDGMNDAPALAKATVGISMGKIGSATAVEASDVVLLQDDIALLPFLVHKARRTKRILWQNLTLALIVIACATTPALLGLIPLWLAVILHEGGTVLVGLNSLRLLRNRG